MDQLVPADVAILDLLRKQDSMTIAQFSAAMQVTATAVRQRLTRLLAQGYIQRQTESVQGRGRPGHRYSLTSKGRRQTGANFADLAIALWQEIRLIKDPDVRRGLLQRISARLAEHYQQRIEAGEDLTERMKAIAQLFESRQVPFDVVQDDGQLPVLTALACPYPELAEQDRSICAMERMLFSELLNEKVKLSQCRLDGDSCCTFKVQ